MKRTSKPLSSKPDPPNSNPFFFTMNDHKRPIPPSDDTAKFENLNERLRDLEARLAKHESIIKSTRDLRERISREGAS